MVPVTKMQQQVHYETVMQTVKQTQYRPQTVESLVSRVVTTYERRSYTESVPVTTTRQVVEESGFYQTGMVPVTSALPAYGCCGILCGGAGGCSATTALVCQQSFVSGPVVRSVPETTYVQQTRTRMVPVQKTIQVEEARTDMVPVTVDVQVPEQQPRTTEVSVTVKEPKLITETVPVTTTIMVPQERTETVATVQSREVTENVTRQIAVTVPVTPPVTTLITRPGRVSENE